MDDPRGYLPFEWKSAVRYYGGVASKDKKDFTVKVETLCIAFNNSAKKMEKNINNSGFTDIAMLHRQDIHAYHYEMNYQTQDNWVDSMNMGAKCVLCDLDKEHDRNTKKLKNKMNDDEGVAYMVLNLLPPHGFKEWSAEAVDSVLNDDAQHDEKEKDAE